jgi:hypothetical protein
MFTQRMRAYLIDEPYTLPAMPYLFTPPPSQILNFEENLSYLTQKKLFEKQNVIKSYIKMSTEIKALQKHTVLTSLIGNNHKFYIYMDIHGAQISEKSTKYLNF